MVSVRLMMHFVPIVRRCFLGKVLVVVHFGGFLAVMMAGSFLRVCLLRILLCGLSLLLLISQFLPLTRLILRHASMVLFLLCMLVLRNFVPDLLPLVLILLMLRHFRYTREKSTER
jgi:hypothetical protein